jgi:hypothetical protein
VVEISEYAGSNSPQLAAFGQNLSLIDTPWLATGKFIIVVLYFNLLDSECGHRHLTPVVARCRFVNIQHLAIFGIDINTQQGQMFDRESQRFVGRSILPVGPGQLREDQPRGTLTQAHHLLVIAA